VQLAMPEVADQISNIQKNTIANCALRSVLKLEQVRLLAESLKENTSLVELNLGGAELGDDGLKTIAVLWDKERIARERAKAKLTEAEMSEKEKERQREMELREMEREVLVQLTTLELFRNHIGYLGIEALAKAFTWGAMPRLMQLFLSHNEIGDPGALALAKAFAGGSTMQQLEVLDLYGNQIGREGVEALAVACGGLDRLIALWETERLSKQRVRATFELYRTQIGDVFMDALTSVLAHAATVDELLPFGKDQIGEASADALLRAFPGGALPKVRKLHLDIRGIPDTTKEAMHAAVAEGSKGMVLFG